MNYLKQNACIGDEAYIYKRKKFTAALVRTLVYEIFLKIFYNKIK